MIKNSISAGNHDRFLFRLSFFFLILFGLGITLYLPALQSLLSSILQRQDSSIGIFVPFLSGYLLWSRFSEIKHLQFQTNWGLGGGVTLTGIILFFLSKYTVYSLPLAILSLLAITGGLILVLFGVAIFKKTAFPLFFLATMIPIPPAIYDGLAEQVRLISTWGSVKLTRLFGVPIYQDGFNVHLMGRAHLFVANSCSGIRYIVSFFALGLFYAAMFKQSIAGRLMVIFGFILLGILGGMVRLTTIFLSVHYIGPFMGEHWPHVILSWTVFAILLLGGIALDKYLSKH